MPYENHDTDTDDDFYAARNAEFDAAQVVIDRLLESAAEAGAQGDLLTADRFQAEAVRIIRTLR